MAGVLTLGVALLYAMNQQVFVGLSLSLLTIPLHAYPVLLQRWNRARVLRINRRLSALQRAIFQR